MYWEGECVDGLRNILGGVESVKTGFELNVVLSWNFSYELKLSFELISNSL